MKTANILVYGNSAVYIKYCTVCLKIDNTLRCLEYICPVSSPYLLHSPLRLFNHEDTDKRTLNYNMHSSKSHLINLVTSRKARIDCFLLYIHKLYILKGHNFRRL